MRATTGLRLSWMAGVTGFRGGFPHRCGSIPLAATNQRNTYMEKPRQTFTVKAGTRVYYGDIRDEEGKTYITITEIPTKVSPPGKKRQRVFIHHANWSEFYEMMTKINERINNS